MEKASVFVKWCQVISNRMESIQTFWILTETTETTHSQTFTLLSVRMPEAFKKEWPERGIEPVGPAQLADFRHAKIAGAMHCYAPLCDMCDCINVSKSSRPKIPTVARDESCPKSQATPTMTSGAFSMCLLETALNMMPQVDSLVALQTGSQSQHNIESYRITLNFCLLILTF